MVSYDYVIVGAGSAGCVLADKLSADGKNSVLVLEAGPMDRDLLIHMPAGVYRAHMDPRINWNYLTEGEPELYDRRVDMPRGDRVPARGVRALRSTRLPAGRAGTFRLSRWAA